MERGLLEQNAVGPALEQARGGKELPLSGPERRQRTRVFSQLPLTVKFGGIYEIGAEAVNISARGMLFVLPQPLAMGEAIELVFRLPRRVIGVDGIWLRCPAEVVRVEEGLPEGKFGIGAKIKSYEVFLG
ncbi:MAG TPA: PilZ domain-containing protein [Terriglobales bacterium]